MATYGRKALLENMFGVKTLVSALAGDYSGDAMCLVEEKGKLGFLTYGWGSCSMCDAYEAALEYDGGLEDFGASLYGSIRWFDSITEAKEYLTNEKDYNGSYNPELGLEFKEKVQEYFSGRA